MFAHELPRITVSSAGTYALVGEPIAPRMVALLRERGIETTTFSARMLTTQMLKQANLVLTMTRAQRGAVAVIHPPVVRRAFTLREFAAILSPPDAFASLSAAPIPARAARATEKAGMHRAALTKTASALADRGAATSAAPRQSCESGRHQTPR